MYQHYSVQENLNYYRMDYYYQLLLNVLFDYVVDVVVVGNGVRERNGNVSTNGVEPNGVGVLLRGFSKY